MYFIVTTVTPWRDIGLKKLWKLVLSKLFAKVLFKAPVCKEQNSSINIPYIYRTSHIIKNRFQRSKRACQRISLQSLGNDTLHDPDGVVDKLDVVN